MDVVVVGSGGREHALAVVLARPRPSWSRRATRASPARSPRRPRGLDRGSVRHGAGDPLVDGLADPFHPRRASWCSAPGPTAPNFEGSKAWMKQILDEAGVPAHYASFTVAEQDEAVAFLDTFAPPFVREADGLAAGKGVLVTESIDEARAAVGESACSPSQRQQSPFSDFSWCFVRALPMRSPIAYWINCPSIIRSRRFGTTAARGSGLSAVI